MNSLVNSASLNNAGILLGPGSGNMPTTGNNSGNSNGSAPNGNHRSIHAPQTPANMLNMGHQQQQHQSQQQQQQQAIRNDALAQLDLSSDLNFDPAAVIDGGGEGQEGLNVRENLPLHSISVQILRKPLLILQLLPDSVVDPMDLLSYLDPPELATPPSSGGSSVGGGGNSLSGQLSSGSLCVNSTNDDLLALFD